MIGPLLGEDHPLNVSNALAGIVYYTIMMFLSEWMCVSVCVCTQIVHVHISENFEGRNFGKLLVTRKILVDMMAGLQ